MPVPPHDPNGNLPPGVHDALWGELVACFGWNERRRSLLDGLRLALDALRASGCRRAYIDGSFVTTKDLPGDFDGCWEMAGVDFDTLERLAPALLDMQAPRVAQKQAYGGEMFIAEFVADTLGRPYLTFFQYDRDGNPKGIVAFELDGLA